MRITTEASGERELVLTIEVDEEREARARRETARHISREVNIPGFRKGKAPYEVVEQRLGASVVRDELVAHVAEEVYQKALDEEGIVPYAPGALEEVSLDPLTLRFTVPLVPEVDLGDYRDYRRGMPEVEVPQDALDQALEAIRERNAVVAPLDRPAADGDLVIGDLSGILKGGAEFLHQEDAQVLLDLEGDTGIPGFQEGLIGVEGGQTHSFELTLPEDFEAEELRGQLAEFEIKVENVYERILPQLDDDLARTVGNYDSLEELKKVVEERLREERRGEIEARYAEEVLNDIIDQAEVSYPEVVVDDSLDDAVERYERRVEQEEHMMLEDYLRIQGRSLDDLKEELRPEVEASLVRSLVLGEVVEQEGLEISEEALDAQIAASSEQYGERAEEVRKALSEGEGRRSVHNRMLANAAVERLVTIAERELEEPVDAEQADEESPADASNG